MEGGAEQTSSYTYWVRESTAEAAPLPVPKKLSVQDLSNQPPQPPVLGSLWNSAGTWEEKNLNKWATDRIKDLLRSIGSLEFTNGTAEVTKVSSCTGDAFLVTVRNKKRVGYTYELTIDVKGEWLVDGEKKKVKGCLDIPEFSYGEVDDLEVTVKINEGKDLPHQDKQSIIQDLKSFLQPLREKLLQFEQELKER
ncbi:hypothetical protein BVRB_2g036140 [Beta vulgaris subsp. vulgaris]|uniref:uncharacterized protein LOC104886816 n=1 Tax=Beta vulgaris subsp. vulgaris TaxID=3555 RepID=UPI00053F3E10|nr:uncharacterized protein LOC104886816 [Beta vulgaris subsp. vulgaris]KMT17668.1 hypothetical protein BVRB_2g036140 [Beta vulgaris subsp. vulgaris]